MGRLIDLTGQKFNRLAVISRAPNRGKSTMWNCKCNCGTMTIVDSASVKDGHTKSCGCYNNECRTLTEGEAAFNQLYIDYRQGAKRRGLVFELNRDHFRELTKLRCVYCGIEPAQIKSTPGGDYIYNGIDRFESNKGYVDSNCAPCCGKCNQMKMDLGSVEFLRHIGRIMKFSGEWIQVVSAQ